ncbi:O-methyltransferase, family 3 [Beauveria bassiana ARSEF 2860]|uniref:O-methyltransferase, family 3 n=1 Tax=Beauveria bassiana (strain ARSEF 2860) TaxID=655819 RepID=J5J6J7_BEAB2|nr:O-methyltransferase, family 3 [Beauveria bassiana ARSEF 2860]EJP62128.1 O-methyltransferase, family 3 [Beauveria bassiana ARSEF 2860]
MSLLSGLASPAPTPTSDPESAPPNRPHLRDLRSQNRFQSAINSSIMDSQEQLRALVEQDKNMLRSVDFDNFRSAPQLDAQARSALLRPNARLAAALCESSAQGLPPIKRAAVSPASRRARVTSNRNRRQAPRTWRCKNVGGTRRRGAPRLARRTFCPRLVEEGRKNSNIVFVAADMVGLGEQFDWAVKLTRPNGCIFLDDVVASLYKDGQVGEGGEENILTRVGKDKRVQATLVPIVACHAMVPTPIFNGFIFGTRLG